MEQQLFDVQTQLLAVQTYLLYVAIAAIIAPLLVFVFGYVFGIAKSNAKILAQLDTNKELIASNMNSNQTLILSEIKHINQNIAEIKHDVHSLEAFRVRANEEFMTKDDCGAKMTLLNKGD